MRTLLDFLLLALLIAGLTRAVPRPGTGLLLLLETLLLCAYELAQLVDLVVSRTILPTAMAVGFLAWVVFARSEISERLVRVGVNAQQVCRIALLGRARFDDQDDTHRVALAISAATSEMAAAGQGALIVVERHCGLSASTRTGVSLNAPVTRQLLFEIFVNRGPLHDGAVVVKSGHIIAAGVVLPVGEHVLPFPNRLGFRHRAAIGITMGSDAIAVVVSEETGWISLVERGRIVRNLDEPKLCRAIEDLVHEPRRLQWWPGIALPARRLISLMRGLKKHSARPLEPRVGIATGDVEVVDGDSLDAAHPLT